MYILKIEFVEATDFLWVLTLKMPLSQKFTHGKMDDSILSFVATTSYPTQVKGEHARGGKLLTIVFLPRTFSVRMSG